MLLERVLVALASVVLVLALLSGYAARAVFNSDQFANRAAVALEDESVRALIGERITDQVVWQKPDLIAARPLIASAAGAIAGSRPFNSLFRRAVADVHRAVFDRDRDTVTLTVSDVGIVLFTALEKLRPSLARELRSRDEVRLLERDIGAATGDLARAAERTRLLALILLVAALALMAAALIWSPDRRRTAGRLGVGAAAGGVLLVVAYAVTRSLAIGQVDGPEAQDAAGAVWDAFLWDLRTAAWILAVSGAIVAAAAASLIKPVDVRIPLRRAGELLTLEPERTWVRVLRALALVAAGLIVILARDAVLVLVLTLAGVYLVFEGVSALLRLIYRLPEPGTARPKGGMRRVVVGVVAAALVIGVVGIFVGAGGASTALPARGSCNGSAALCGRPLDRVVLPATHNAMSVPLRGWFSSLQERPIAGQLEDGVRGLLIDVHYADRLPNGNLRTHFGSQEELRRQASEDGVNPDAVDAALRIRERLGFRGGGERGMYVCHSFCELGATPLESVLEDIYEFLVNNPGEVLAIVNQDYVTPEDFTEAVAEAELAELAYRGPFGDDAPTLREMIERDQRVVFLAENKAGAEPWYRLAYESITQETPFGFSQPGQLLEPSALPRSCRPNRGPDSAPLFLVNHWITTDPAPKPSNAAKVNAYEPLLRRARECQKLRKRVPNLLAVDFYREGDLFRVVDTLNR